MKLLYLWVNYSENGFIEKKGFNISGEYYWRYDEEKKLLTSKKKDGYIKGFWSDSNIEDLSVIVGTNGAGKSTVLTELMSWVKITHRRKYNNIGLRVESNKRAEEKKIIVYEENGYIYYDHNLEYEIMTYPIVVQKEMDELKNYTRIYVSNSINNPMFFALSRHEDIVQYALTDYMISDESQRIMEKNKIPNYVYPSVKNDNSRFYDDYNTHRSESRIIKMADELNSRITMGENNYGDLNSLIRLYFLIKSKCKKYIGKTYQYINIKLKNIDKIFKYDDILMPFPMEDNIWKTTSELEHKEKSKLFNQLATFFLYEYQYYYQDMTTLEIKEVSLSQIEEIIKYTKEYIYRDINDSLQENMTTDEYFINAANDLLLFYKLVQENEIIVSGRVYGGESYAEVLRVDLSKNQEFFDRLFLFLERGIPSIFMRYLSFEFEGMSSGEEAMMNLYSRIFWLYNAQHCKKESLILIDEIDLYMHPKWQRGLISYLVEDIPNLIGEGNKAQIIITTHSPIILSDVPRANTIFLENRNGKCIVDNNLSHRDTFGNNVHTLFLDSFFLDDEGTMGEFAEKKINGILKLLRSGERINDEDKTVLKIIKCIGDDLIRNKLLEMYEKNQGLRQQLKEIPTSVENTAIDNTIAVLRNQVAELLRTIEQLEQIKND